MQTKSLPHCHHDKIGSKQDTPKTATNHVSYIMRRNAMTHFQAENMPEGGRGTRGFFDTLAAEAIAAGKEVRICDKLILMLPLELTREQRHQLVADLMHDLGHGKIAWCAAHHDSGEDAHNPHAHVVFKDADLPDPKRRKVLGLGTNARDVKEAIENGWKVPPRMTSNDIRHAYEGCLNRTMEKLGIEIRYDARSYKDRGMEQQPTIHEGPTIHALAEKGVTPDSADKKRGDRVLNYSLTDEGTRIEHNARIKAANAELAAERARSPSEKQADAFETVRDQRGAAKELTQAPGKESAPAAREAMPQPKPQTQEQEEKRQLADAQRKATLRMWQEQKLDREALRKAHLMELAEHRAQADANFAKGRETARAVTKERTAEQWHDIYGLPKGSLRDQAVAALKTDTPKRWEAVGNMPRGDERENAARALEAEVAGQWRVVRGMKRGEDREKAVAGFKVHAKEVYAEVSNAHALAIKAGNSKQLEALKAKQTLESAALKQQHQAETTAMSRHHILDRLATHERWRAADLEKRTQQIERGFSGHQGMVAQNAKAHQLIKLTAQARSVRSASWPIAVPQNPREAAKVYSAQAVVELRTHVAVREKLTAGRQFNVLRSGQISPLLMSYTKEQRARLPKKMQIAIDSLTNVQRAAEQSKSGQAVQSGRTVTDAERVNASPDVKARISRKETSDRARRDGDSDGQSGMVTGGRSKSKAKTRSSRER